MATAAVAAIASSLFIRPSLSSSSISPSTFSFLHPPRHTQTIAINSPPPRKQKKAAAADAAALLPPRCVSATAIATSIDSDEKEAVGEKKLSRAWREIQGSKGWEGLVNPLDPLLRAEVIRYGEFAQACYDAFDFDPHSKYCGACKHEGPTFFHQLDMAPRGYQISRYLYATSNINVPNFFHKPKPSSSEVWSRHANWMGYVAVATEAEEISRLGRRDIVVAWRGTVTYLEWIEDLKDILRQASFGEAEPGVKIESGFYDLYTDKEGACSYCCYSAREQVLAEIKRLVERYKGEELSITITGHSLGAALALVSAYDLAEMRLNVEDDEDGRLGEKIPITVFSFAGPRVGNLKFKERCEELGVKVLRVINVHDKVPTVPGIIANERLKFQKYIEEVIGFPWSYAHVGVELPLDHSRSPFVKVMGMDLVGAHNLELHLHLLDGYQGKEKEYCWQQPNKPQRDLALVNKDSDCLKEELEVPPYWRQDRNKGLLRSVDGRWVVPERPWMEPHPPDTDRYLDQILNMAKSRSLKAL